MNMVLCLCGSTRFKPIFMEAAEKLTLNGAIILMPHVYHHDADSIPISEEDKKKLDALHKKKIDMADALVIITDESKYIGDSTKSEIAYAKDKPVMYWEDIKDGI